MNRMFVALDPPEVARDDLDAFLEPRREQAPFRWTLPESWHLTLAFAEAVPDRAYDDLVDRLSRAGHRHPPMRMRIRGGGAFPNAARARVLYAGVEVDRAGIGHLSQSVRAAMNRAGAAVDGARFTPHLTLARPRRPGDLTRWIRLLESYQGPAFEVTEMSLVASHLGEGPGGRPRYEIRETFALGG